MSSKKDDGIVFQKRKLSQKQEPQRKATSSSIKTSKKHVSHHLSRMYQGRGSMSRLERKKSPAGALVMLFTFLLVVLIFMASAAGFYLFTGNSGPKFDEEKIQLSIRGPQTISTGQSVTYVIDYENQGKIALNDSVISMTYPAGFIVKEVEPSRLDPESTEFEIGVLAPEKKGQVKIKGVLLGTPGSQSTVSARLGFTPDAFQSPFYQYSSLHTELTESILGLEISGPNQAIVDEEVVYTITYQNTSGHDLQDIRLVLKTPKSFSVSSLNPEPTEAQQWDIELLPSETRKELVVKGTYDTHESEKEDILAGLHEFAIDALIKGDQDQYFVQSTTSFDTEILAEGPFITTKVNGQTDGLTADLGERLNVVIDFENKTQETLEDVVLQARLESPILNWTSVSDALDGIISDQTITWTKDELEALGSLDPADPQRISFSINVRDFSSAAELPSSQLEESDILISATLKTEDGSTQQSSAPVSIPVNGYVTFDAQARYYSTQGDPLGSGPLPPQVGGTTSYVIVWTINNTFRTLSSGTVSTRLPVDSEWGGSLSQTHGSISFDVPSQTVTWDTGSLGTDEEAQARFEVEVTPQTKHIGKTVVLTASSELSVKDRKTSGTISRSIPALTTNLDKDSLAKDKGTVVP